MDVAIAPSGAKKSTGGLIPSTRPRPAQYSRGAVGAASIAAGATALIIVTYTFKFGLRRCVSATVCGVVQDLLGALWAVESTCKMREVHCSSLLNARA